jgi:hypothetical protein
MGFRKRANSEKLADQVNEWTGDNATLVLFSYFRPMDLEDSYD